jgi:hypothetical protein
MAKKKVKRSTPKTKKSLYKPETYGIQFDSLTFIIFAVFVLIVLMVAVSNMFGFKLF